MKISKKILISLVILVVFVLILALVIVKLNNNTVSNNKGDDFFIENSFEERTEIIKNILAKNFSVSADKSSILMGREVPGYANGIFLSEELEKQNKGQVYFYAVLSKNVQVVWSGSGDPDCNILKKYKFPEEMKGNCSY